MNKLLFALLLFLAFIFQTTMGRIFPQLEHYFYIPDIPLLLFTFVGLYGGVERSTTTGFLVGFIEDSLGAGLMGVHSLTKTWLGFLLGFVSQQFYSGNRILQFVVVLTMTISHTLFSEVLITLLGDPQWKDGMDFLSHMFRYIFPLSLVNGVMAMALFPLLERWKLIVSESEGA